MWVARSGASTHFLQIGFLIQRRRSRQLKQSLPGKGTPDASRIEGPTIDDRQRRFANAGHNGQQRLFQLHTPSFKLCRNAIHFRSLAGTKDAGGMPSSLRGDGRRVELMRYVLIVLLIFTFFVWDATNNHQRFLRMSKQMINTMGF